jgi:hypothetical protein
VQNKKGLTTDPTKKHQRGKIYSYNKLQEAQAGKENT